MALLFLTLAFACQNGQVVSRKIEGCYHEASLSQLLNETRIDPIEVRWVNGVEEICRYSDGQIEVHHPKKTNATCSPNDLCFDLPAEVFEPVPPAEVSTAIFGSEKKMYWSKNSLSKKLKAMDDDWAVEMLARYGGASRLDDGTGLSLIERIRMREQKSKVFERFK